MPDPKTYRIAGDLLAALRIIDANFNRASEGLRVVEEQCRFAMGDQHLTECCKQLRHDLTATIQLIRPAQLLAARDTPGDVGTSVKTPAEATRHTIADIAAASWKRIEQALRAIEEYGKLVSPELATRAESIRYRVYTLAKACTITVDSQARLERARLYVLIDGGRSECEFVQRVNELIESGVHVLQLRDKQLDDRTLLARARLLKRILDQSRFEGASERAVERANGSAPNLPLSPSPTLPLFILNDRPDLAVLARADGVHLGQEELTVHDARQIVGPDMLVGISTHNIEQARQAVLDGASYLGFGPVFPSGTKHFAQFPGLELLRQAAAEIALPAFAIGGITLENLPQVLGTGFSRVAVGGTVAASQDAAETVQRLIEQIEAHSGVADGK
jgi:thiamine-phosphate pyrophosphorylase